MNHALVIDSLRRRIAAKERLSPLRHPSVALGPAPLDAALPANGLQTGALHELVPATSGDFAASAGFATCLLTRITRLRPGPVLWVVPAHQAFSEGGLYPLGLAALGFDPDRLIELRVRKPIDILWALEEGLAHAPLSAVIGILPDNARAYDFPASRRLAMRAARQGGTALILRSRQTAGEATAAETRWSVAGLPSAPARGARAGPGAPRWRLQLVKCRKGISGHGSSGWDVEWDHEALSFRLPAPLADRAPAWAHGAANVWSEAS
ncbi:ImuA family protein [Nitratireductor sp. ZSWI3]|uniref:ImuA family protein n=1 Tax=Nitratireductor sp. ZSWI3 TaxID=2966359 RepID=UPI0021504E98|nr:inducible mutagenesis protein A [Nitratireductor sp. ZSWI3]MCR4269390.1 inducible mutagenesis protein A [Nitratireductor sp. ZSWI3]